MRTILLGTSTVAMETNVSPFGERTVTTMSPSNGRRNADRNWPVLRSMEYDRVALSDTLPWIVLPGSGFGRGSCAQSAAASTKTANRIAGTPDRFIVQLQPISHQKERRPVIRVHIKGPGAMQQFQLRFTQGSQFRHAGSRLANPVKLLHQPAGALVGHLPKAGDYCLRALPLRERSKTLNLASVAKRGIAG